jgi:GT2 family glycosyltransferase
VTEQQRSGGRITIVVVSFNSASLLPDFFASLPQALEGIRETEVVLADNDSTDGSIEVARREWPDVTVVALPRNLGYSAGINAAVAAARPADAILISNDDIRFRPGSIRRLLDHLTPPFGIVVPRLIDSDGTLLKSLKREPSVLRVLGEALLGGDRSGRISLLGEVVQDPDAYRRPTEAAWASGCALLIDRLCWDAVGPWDESFFLYAEDIDFALRAGDRGFRLRLVPEAEAVHLVGPSHENPRLWAMSVWNRYRVFRRRHGILRSTAYRVALIVNEALRAALGRKVHRAGLGALLSARFRPEEVR